MKFNNIKIKFKYPYIPKKYKVQCFEYNSRLSLPFIIKLIIDTAGDNPAIIKEFSGLKNSRTEIILQINKEELFFSGIITDFNILSYSSAAITISPLLSLITKDIPNMTYLSEHAFHEIIETAKSRRINIKVTDGLVLRKNSFLVHSGLGKIHLFYRFIFENELIYYFTHKEKTNLVINGPDIVKNKKVNFISKTTISEFRKDKFNDKFNKSYNNILLSLKDFNPELHCGCLIKTEHSQNVYLISEQRLSINCLGNDKYSIYSEVFAENPEFLVSINRQHGRNRKIKPVNAALKGVAIENNNKFRVFVKVLPDNKNFSPMWLEAPDTWKYIECFPDKEIIVQIGFANGDPDKPYVINNKDFNTIEFL